MNSLLIAPFYLNGCGSVINEPETRNKIPGNRAIWVGIFAEMTEFAMFFIVYFIAKAHYPEQFSQGPLHLNTLAGTLNTIAKPTAGTDANNASIINNLSNSISVTTLTHL